MGLRRITAKVRYRTKVMLCYLLAVSLPYTAGVVYLHNTMIASARQGILTAIEQRVDQEQSTVERKLDDIHRSAYYFATNSVLNNFFTPNFTTDIQLVERMNTITKPLLSWMEATMDNTGGFRFLTMVEAVPQSEFVVHLAPYRGEPWVRDMLAGVGEKGYAYAPLHEARPFLYTKTEPGPRFSLFYRLPGTTAKFPTYLETDILPQRLFGDMNNTPIAETGFMIPFCSGAFLAAPGEPPAAGGLAASPEGLAIARGERGPGDVTLGGARHYVSARQIPQLDCSLVCVIPTGEIDRTVLDAQNTFIANLVSMNTSYFSTLFKKKTNMGFTNFLHTLRVKKAKALLLESNAKILAVAEAVGFHDEKYFFKVFKKETGVTPNAYRRHKT
jgi:hypothetical protein